MGLPSN